jgi:hypothetical protein
MTKALSPISAKRDGEAGKLIAYSESVQAALPNAEGKMEIRALSPDMYRVEYEAARRLGLPVSVHPWHSR